MIGVYDSGFGGLDVLRELKRQLPERSFVYLGDSGRAPYGGRDVHTLLDFAEQAVERLFDEGCRLVIVACNTISCVALRHLQQRYCKGSTYRILGVTIPGAERAVMTSAGHIAVMATERTVASGTYTTEIGKLSDHRVTAIAAPLLAAVVEQGWEQTEVAAAVVGRYLEQLPADADTVLLGCTHYPLLIEAFEASLRPGVKLVDPAPYVAERLQDWLERHPDYDTPDPTPRHRVLCTGDIDAFRRSGARFLGEPLPQVEHVAEVGGRLRPRVPRVGPTGQVVRGPRPDAANRAHTIVTGLLQLLELAVPGAVEAAYLTGSFADTTYVPASDIDAVVVLTPAGAAARSELAAITRSAGMITHRGLDVLLLSRDQLMANPDMLRDRMVRLVAGPDIRIELAPTDPSHQLRVTIHRAALFVCRGRRTHTGLPAASLPLTPPDPNGRYLGYDFRTHVRHGEAVPSVKELAVVATRVASGLLALRGHLTHSKTETVTRFGETGGPHGDTVATVHQRVRGDWGYEIPASADEQEELIGLCDRVFALERDFIAALLPWLIKEISGADAEAVGMAARTLVLLCTNDEAVVEALEAARDRHPQRAADIDAALATQRRQWPPSWALPCP